MTTPIEALPPFTTPEGLRLLLVRLRYLDADGWRAGPEAVELVDYTIEKYAALSHKYGFEPMEGATAAFEAMRTRAVRVGEDPWAVITHAVELSLIYERRAEGLVCSSQEARRKEMSEFHDAERLSECESASLDYRATFSTRDPQDAEEPDDDRVDRPKTALQAARELAETFHLLGWPAEVAVNAVGYICNKLARCGNRQTAFEALRRDAHGRALVDVDQDAWLVLLRIVLGNQHIDRRQTTAGRGMLMRLLIGDSITDLVSDLPLVAEIASIRQPASVRIAEAGHA